MKIHLMKGIAGKWNPKIDPTMARAFANRNWWYWMPRLGWNGGIPFKHAVTDIHLSWLCFWFGFLIYWLPPPKSDQVTQAIGQINK